jgi:hypothetical protein
VDTKLSVVIPSYKDPLVIPTIKSLLENSELGDQLEILPVYGNCWTELWPDPRIRIIHLDQNLGMRGHINAGVKEAKGEFIMRTDSHCMFGKGYDRILTETCQPNWIVTARRFFLDPVKWEIMQDMPPVDYEKLVIIHDEKGNDVKFSGQPWRSRSAERKDIMIDETMAMQGSMWVMPHKWWNDVIGELQSEGYGTLYQDSHEMIFKTWKAGGKMMLNKNTWYAHKHRSFPRTHNDGAGADVGWRYSLNTWKDYYDKEIFPTWFR